ncbi:DUF6221 family protein [Kitasatospora sp. NPDC058478]|uniref:DUF6221 family protein n=1 Tax=unclassified Kitasatospora TaxID=2633591 RepID=UPI00366842C0
MTADLVAFLAARLDEDEQNARQATTGPWHVLGGGSDEYAISTTPDGKVLSAEVAAPGYAEHPDYRPE